MPIANRVQSVAPPPYWLSDSEIRDFLAKWQTSAHADCDRATFLGVERHAIAVDSAQYAESRTEPSPNPPIGLEDAGRVLHERGLYALSSVLKAQWRQHVWRADPRSEDALRAREYELASLAALPAWRSRTRLHSIDRALHARTASRPRALLYEASHYANLGRMRSAQRALRLAEHALGRTQGAARNKYVEDYWIRRIQVLRNPGDVRHALSVTADDHYRHNTTRILEASIAFQYRNSDAGAGKYADILRSPDSLSWRYRADAWFAIGCHLLNSDRTLELAYRHLVAAQYVNALLGVLGVPHNGFHVLGAHNGRVMPTDVLHRDPRLRRLSRAARTDLRHRAILESRLQRDLLDDLAGRLRTPPNPGRTLVVTPSDFVSCFVSYSSKDEKFMERLIGDLRRAGVRCTLADHELSIGDRISVALDNLIEAHDRFLLIVSANSLHSKWVAKEIKKALQIERDQNRRILVPIRLDNTILQQAIGWGADLTRARVIGDFRGQHDDATYDIALKRLLRDLRRD